MKQQPGMSIEEALKQTGSKTELIPTSFGAMKIRYEDHVFIHHFTRNSIARYRCALHESMRCPASIIIKEKLTYPFITSHNHQKKKWKETFWHKIIFKENSLAIKRKNLLTRLISWIFEFPTFAKTLLTFLHFF